MDSSSQSRNKNVSKPSPLEEIVARALAHWLRGNKASQSQDDSVPKDNRKPLK
jgi:hypothetical protein